MCVCVCECVSVCVFDVCVHMCKIMSVFENVCVCEFVSVCLCSARVNVFLCE